MAWPCISRVCCLARFWSQLDKSDLSVPLTIQNYSDIAEQEVRSVTKQVAADRIPRNDHLTLDHGGSPLPPGGGPGTRGSFRGRREPSYKPRDDYHPPGVPFQSVTQYKQDFKPWPIPKKENFPWISNGGSRADSVSDSPINSYSNAGQPQGDRGEREERGRGQRWGDHRPTAPTKISSYRQEYRPWTGVRPAKSTKKPPPAPYISPECKDDSLPPETSYQAAYSGETHRPSGQQPAHHHLTTTITNIIPTPPASTPPQPIPATAAPTSDPQPSSQPEKPDCGVTTKGEEHLVRTKLPPNPSAVFQSGSRIFNI